MPVPNTIRLSAETFAVTWYYAGVAEAPLALYLPMPGGDLTDQARAEIRATREIGRLAGTDPAGFVPELERRYRLLAHAPLEYYGWAVRGDGACLSVHVAQHPHATVCAVLTEDTAEVSIVDSTSGPAVLLSALPRCAAADFQPASVRLAELESVERRGAVLHEVAPPVSAELAIARRVCAVRATGKGQLHVAERSAAGTRRASASPVQYIDAPAGRILFYLHGSGADRHFVARPGDPAAIAARLEQVRAGLSG